MEAETHTKAQHECEGKCRPVMFYSKPLQLFLLKSIRTFSLVLFAVLSKKINKMCTKILMVASLSACWLNFSKSSNSNKTSSCQTSNQVHLGLYLGLLLSFASTLTDLRKPSCVCAVSSLSNLSPHFYSVSLRLAFFFFFHSSNSEKRNRRGKRGEMWEGSLVSPIHQQPPAVLKITRTASDWADWAGLWGSIISLEFVQHPGRQTAHVCMHSLRDTQIPKELTTLKRTMYIQYLLTFQFRMWQTLFVTMQYSVMFHIFPPGQSCD